VTWTYTNLMIQIVGGLLGAHAAATVTTHGHGFGGFGHSIVGMLAGTVSGCFLQELAHTLVTPGGSRTEPTALEEGILQGLVGATSGAILVLAIGFLKHGIDSRKRPD
jgi:hypothetical protein